MDGTESTKAKFCLKKVDLAEYICMNLSYDRAKSLEIVDDFVECIKSGLESERKVLLSGFGSFEVKHKPARKGRNPQTGEAMTLKERNVLKFKPSQILRRAINGQTCGSGDVD